MPHNAYAFTNPYADAPDSSYGVHRESVMSQAGFDAAFAEISSWPGYSPTPLVSLPELAQALGIAELLYKDERGRFGLGSFKALGGAYAVANVLRLKVQQAHQLAHVSSKQLLSGAFKEAIGAATVTCATDGNHGRSVAWGARLFGCHCVIYVHETVSQGRRDAIARYGADVREVKGNYDDAVRFAAATAAEQGWTVVSDTSYPGYRDIPLDVMHGYGVMASEIVTQMSNVAPPTHVFAQAGVGALASAVCANFWLQWGTQRPLFVVTEPTQADCVYQSLQAGQRSVVHGTLDTVMAGLACGEVSELAWEILQGGTNIAIAIDDAYALEAMRMLAKPQGNDPVIVAGETGGVGLAALLAARDHPDIRQQLGLNAQARVLLLGSEGDTDPLIYQQVVGKTAAEVLA